MNVAAPAVSGADPIAAPPSLKVTLPVGASVPEVCVTVAVRVTASPAVDGLGVADSAVLVPDWLRSTLTSLEVAFAVATSVAPSPLKSPAARATGLLSVAKGARAQGVKPPLPSPISTLTLLEGPFAVATSSRPSPLRSARTTPRGPVLTGKLPRGAKPPDPLPRRTETEFE